MSLDVNTFLAPTQTEWGYSKWSTLERCPKEYELGYIHRIRPRTQPAAAMLGTVIHRGLAAHYSGGKEDFVREVIMAGTEPTATKLDAMRFVLEHNRYWSDRDPGWDEVIEVEKSAFKLIDGVVPFTTRYDLVVRQGDRFMPVDHKSAAKKGDASAEWGMSGQFMGMVELFDTLGLPTTHPSVRVNRIIKTNTPSFERVGIAFTETHLARWRADLLALNDDRETYERRGRYPRRYSACVRRYGLCSYYDLCRAGTSSAEMYDMPEETNLEEALR